MKYDVAIIGAGPGGIFSAYELLKKNEKLKIVVFEAGYPLEQEPFLMENITLPMILVEHYMSISDVQKLSN